MTSNETNGIQKDMVAEAEREYADLDWITPKGKSSRVQKFFESLGYVPQSRFNTMYGRKRLLYFDEEHDRQVDILVGTFRMSHEIPFGNQFEDAVRRCLYCPFRTDPDEMTDPKKDEKLSDELFPLVDPHNR